MMKYKVLVTGKNSPIIDDLFAQMNNDFEIMTTSIRHDDIVRHLNYFEPDVFVCCIFNETRDTINQIANAKYRLTEKYVPVILIGAKEECDEFEKIAVHVADMTLYRPIAGAMIGEKIRKFLEEHPKKVEEQPKEEEGALGAELLAQGAAMDGLLRELESGGKAAQTPQAAQAGGGVGTKSALRKHVLVVDDNSMMLKLIKEYLHEKYDVATAASGKIALKFLERKKTDLILLDYEMPVVNGPAVLEQLRASDATKNIPVVFLTGVTETKKIQEALILKPQSYLLKPINQQKLLDTIEKIIG